MQKQQEQPRNPCDLSTEDLAEIGLEESELDFLQELAEHPELGDYDLLRAGRWTGGKRGGSDSEDEESERRFGEWLDEMERKHGISPYLDSDGEEEE